MGDKKLYSEACDKLNFQLQNKRATLNLIYNQWVEANNKRRQLHKQAHEIEKQTSEGILTYGEAATRLDATRLLLKNVSHNIYVTGLQFLDSYKDQKFRNIELFMSSAKYRSAWREETSKLVRKKYSHLIGNKSEISSKKPCRFFNNGRCRNLECSHKHICSECYNILKVERFHVYSPDCPLYVIRKQEYENKTSMKDAERKEEQTSSSGTKKRKLDPLSSSSSSSSASTSSSSTSRSPTPQRKTYKKTNKPNLIKNSSKRPA